jgi:hypothetical protein
LPRRKLSHQAVGLAFAMLDTQAYPADVKRGSRSLGRNAARILRVGMVSVLLTAPAVFPLTAAAGGRNTYTSPDCQHLRTRPRHIIFACADSGYYVDHLHWDSWHPWKARGEGVFHENDCRPDCADGTFHARPGRLVLRKRTWCSGLHKYVFKRAHARYTSPLLGNRKASFRLPLPKRC